MAQKKIKFSEAAMFAKDNGYWYAVYKMDSKGNYLLLETCLWNTNIDNDTEIMVKTIGSGTDFKEFTTADETYCFRLHNNFNVPPVIPVIRCGCGCREIL